MVRNSSLPFALSLSKGVVCPAGMPSKERGFDKLSPNGFGFGPAYLEADNG